MNTKIDMHLGKLISIKEASKLLAEKDNGDVSLTWTLRFCLNEYVRFAIKVPFEVSVWEWKEELDIGENCGKCVDIADQRQALMMQDGKDGKYITESDLPSYCDNCHKTGIRLRMGAGDFIRTYAGVFFLFRSDVEFLVDSNNKEVTCYKLYLENNDWKRGYMPVETASSREDCLWQYDSYSDEGDLHDPNNEFDDSYSDEGDLHDPNNEFGTFIKEQCEEESNDSGLIVKRNSIYLWLEDFENALNNKGYAERRENEIIEPQRATDLATFIVSSLKTYKTENEGKTPEGTKSSKATKLLDFCVSNGSCAIENKESGKDNWIIKSNCFKPTKWRSWKERVSERLKANKSTQ